MKDCTNSFRCSSLCLGLHSVESACSFQGNPLGSQSQSMGYVTHQRGNQKNLPAPRDLHQKSPERCFLAVASCLIGVQTADVTIFSLKKTPENTKRKLVKHHAVQSALRCRSTLSFLEMSANSNLWWMLETVGEGRVRSDLV